MAGELERAVRHLQSQLIEESGEAISFSKTLEVLIQRALNGNERDEGIVLDYMCNKHQRN